MSHGWVQGLEYIPTSRYCHNTTGWVRPNWLSNFMLCYGPLLFVNNTNERSSGNVLHFWTTISKKRRINITRADGVLRMLEGTTAEQQHVFNIQQQDLLGLYQPSDDGLFEEDHQPKTPSMRPRQSEKDVFESAITASLNPTPAHPFQQVRKTILYDLPFELFYWEKEDRIVPLFKAIQSVYREYSFNWIEVQASCIKDTKEWFPEFDFTLNQVF
ncbi:hypothetical protein RhiirC2_782100 [Rhizophagus irregularis]|uniref:Uncharacterized protein n=1 Tax=Rhizophagus irregularis TaxID=588596 RepID=A0A2N1N3X6_9GLOM|nr:hypothetical protein RhiirC2_782100 [Rhizophagus irregularis]